MDDKYTVDTANRSKGSDKEPARWLVDKSHGYFGIYCSNCDTRFPLGIGADTFNYCPSCGRAMVLGI